MKSSYRGNSISLTANAIIHAIFIIISLSCIVPLLLVIAVSFSDEQTVVVHGYRFLPDKLSLDAYRYLWQEGRTIMNAYGVTVFTTVVGTVLSLAVISTFAYPLSRKDFAYRKLFTFLVVFTLLFNGGLVSWYLVTTQVLHLKNNIWALIIPHLFNGWYVMIMKTYFNTTIPDPVIESAKIDGAGEFRTFLTIVLPLSLPGLATIGLFSAIVYWNDWWLPLMLITNDKLLNVQYLLYKAQSFADFLSSASGLNYGSVMQMSPPSLTLRMALAVVGIGPIVLAYPFFQKYFVQGLTIGAVKG
ncbi:putative aldouronate transport system permease protein [Paenibacillus sp. UNCCL117]|uniref:carbohydrate ABC transporter permease n=1 Tax=unclassified Paenibacillus TaxID=185978 RepID=UPI000891602D|nr:MULTISPECIES: carbohydrate ABC transporter permease [unclassified Paenibacillus]SDD03703.1 carbohydrate ABC transporter membrane protein 2, CUT1 family [Paenibacillus sp. cl123]SFW32248.1 putative aldouronate transport system permease protein [Paenibacillus sp. UNCCL117]